MRHRFHSICPYFAMFPETFVEKHLAASPHRGVVFDPFCGRGTAVFQALLQDRDAAGGDVNPVAVCITGAKCDPPRRSEVKGRLAELIVRIGGRRLSKAELRDGLQQSLSAGLNRSVRLVDTGISSKVINTQANAFRGTKASRLMEHDFSFKL